MKALTKFFAAVLTVTTVYLPTVATPAAAGGCGVWRWPVKTLSDPDRFDVHFNPLLASVKSFRLRPRPPISFNSSTARYGQVEHHTWKLTARPIQAKLEDDLDIHLVISVPTAPAKTMIVEFPKKFCVASPFKRFKIATARQQFLNNCGSVSSSSWLKLAGRVTIVGVGFWDAKHGQTGVAPNGIELHPVLNSTGDCHKASSGGGGGGGGNCDPSYPTVCIPPPPPDLNCADIPYRNFTVIGADPHNFDGDNDGVGCEA